MATIDAPADGPGVVTGTTEDDLIHVGRGDQSIDGGAGVDVADFSRTVYASIVGGGATGVGLNADLTTGLAVVTNWTLRPAPVFGEYFTYNYTLTNIESLIGTSGGDVLKAGTSSAELTGLGGSDILIGNVGNDVLTGGAGADRLTGGAGADLFKFSATIVQGLGGVVDSYAGAIDSITDFETGLDKLDLTGVQNLGTVSIVRSGDGSVVFGEIRDQSPDIQIVIGVTGVIQAGDIVGSLAVQMVGDTRDDLLIGAGGGDTLYGQDGADVLIGGAGADALYGGAGADTFKYLSASDSTNATLDILHDFRTAFDAIDLTALNPTNVSVIRYNGGSFVSGLAADGHVFQIASTQDVNASDLVGLTSGAYIVGDGDPNVLIGSGLNETIDAGAGDDVIVGGGGADALFGGAGADTFKYGAASNSTPSSLDILHDFQTGIDKIDLTALNPNNVSILRSNGGSFISGVTTGGAVFQIASTQDVNVNDLLGLSGAVYMAGDGGANVLIGGPGNSTEWAGLGNDTIDGGAGNDTLIGGSGADSLIGGAGADTFKYLLVSDSSYASYDGIRDFQTGVDKLDISALNLRNVSISRDVGGTLFEGDAIDGQKFYLRSTADINAPDVIGLTTGVKISGNMGTDTLIGGAFDDVISGGAGTDTIIGGGGADVMSGTGTGLVYVSPDVNTFVYQAPSDSTAAAADKILGFQTGLDKIDLRAVHTAAGDTVNFLSDATTTYLFVQQAGHASPDMVILLDTPTFAMTDILW